MSEENIPAARALGLREDDENFYLVVSRPFKKRELNYKRLQSMGDCTVRRLKSGSQVFVFPRTEFDPDDVMDFASEYGFTDTELFRDRVRVAAQQMRGLLAIDSTVESIEADVTPAPTKSI